MVRAAGGVERLAAALDVSRQSVWNYARSRRTPGPFSQAFINHWAKGRG